MHARKGFRSGFMEKARASVFSALLVGGLMGCATPGIKGKAKTPEIAAPKEMPGSAPKCRIEARTIFTGLAFRLPGQNPAPGCPLLEGMEFSFGVHHSSTYSFRVKTVDELKVRGVLWMPSVIDAERGEYFLLRFNNVGIRRVALEAIKEAGIREGLFNRELPKPPKDAKLPGLSDLRVSENLRKRLLDNLGWDLARSISPEFSPKYLEVLRAAGMQPVYSVEKSDEKEFALFVYPPGEIVRLDRRIEQRLLRDDGILSVPLRIAHLSVDGKGNVDIRIALDCTRPAYLHQLYGYEEIKKGESDRMR